MWNTALLAACGTTTIPSDATASHLDSRPVTHSVSHTGAHSADEATPTNILLLMIDDIGLDKINAYHEIEADVRTPTMDGLAAEGVLFRNAWGYPSCQAARGAFMTGRHARRTGLGRNWNYRVQGIEEYYAFPQEEVTLAEVVAASSDPWSSSFIGKWHLTTIQDAFGPDPVRQGWQYFSGTLENLQVSVTAGRDDPGSYFRWRRWDGDGSVEVDTRYATTAAVDDAIERLEVMPEPWLLEVSFHSCHTPLHLPPRDLYTYTWTSRPDAFDATRAMVEALDTEIARLLAALPPDVRERTTIILAGDNGSASGTAEDLEGQLTGKSTLFDAGIRVPLIVTGPNVAQPGSESDALVSLVDVLPTVAEIAGVDLTTFESPRYPGSPLPIDGLSLLPALADPTAPIHDRLWTEKFGLLGASELTIDERALRDERYKLMTDAIGGKVAFFDYEERGSSVLHEGPNLLMTEVPLTAEHRAAFDRLSAEMDARVQAMQDDRPFP